MGSKCKLLETAYFFFSRRDEKIEFGFNATRSIRQFTSVTESKVNTPVRVLFNSYLGQSVRINLQFLHFSRLKEEIVFC